MKTRSLDEFADLEKQLAEQQQIFGNREIIAVESIRELRRQLAEQTKRAEKAERLRIEANQVSNQETLRITGLANDAMNRAEAAEKRVAELEQQAAVMHASMVFGDIADNRDKRLIAAEKRVAELQALVEAADVFWFGERFGVERRLSSPNLYRVIKIDKEGRQVVHTMPEGLPLDEAIALARELAAKEAK